MRFLNGTYGRTIERATTAGFHDCDVVCHAILIFEPNDGDSLVTG